MMKWFYNMKIRTQIITSFLIIALFTAVVGITGVRNMRAINQRSEDMYNYNLLGSQYLKEIQVELQSIRANQVAAVNDKNSQTLITRLEAIDESAKKCNDLLINYEKTIQTEENRSLYNHVVACLNEYTLARDENLELVREGQADKASETSAKVTQAREKADEALQQLVDYAIKEASDAIVKNKENFTHQTITMRVIISVSILVAVLLGLIIATMTSRQFNQLIEVANKITDGDLNVSVDIDSGSEIGALAKAFMRMADNLNEVMSSISLASQQVSVGAKQVSDSSIVLAQGSAEQASSIEELTAALDQVAVNTKLNAENANHSNELTKTVQSSALTGNSQMKEMLHAMQEINVSASNISRIIKVIDEIAFQTNILALNAAVEAARAGQHGKGFAVVAEEVRNLAARSASAAKETTDMIENSIKKAEEGTRIANQTAQSLTEMIDGIEKVTQLVSEIAKASNEQAAAIEQINQAIRQVSDVVQNNSSTSEESAAASEELSNQAMTLRELVERFKLKRVKAYKDDEVNPAVLSMLNNISKGAKKTANSLLKPNHGANQAIDISLEDGTFGKY